MNISHTAKAAGLNPKTIRYYESVGLTPLPRRKDNGYRDYDGNDVERLIFLRQARNVGFTIEQCRALLGLYENPQRQSAQVYELVKTKVQEVDRKIQELQSMRSVLDQLTKDCPNDGQPECTIIDSMAGYADQAKLVSDAVLSSEKPLIPSR